MKNVTAVICELNPLHKGHEYLIDRAGSRGGVVVLVMSGNFTERSSPAVFDKYSRAAAAVKCGADLVIELPFPWCTYGVEGFARGGVSVAAAIGADTLVFGSESGDYALISKVAGIKASDDYAEKIKKADTGSRSTGTAGLFDRILAEYGIEGPLGPNDKLGAEYIRYGSMFGIENFVPVKRKEGMSASDIRELMAREGREAIKGIIPDCAWDVFRDSVLCSEAEYEKFLFHYARLALKCDDPIVNHAVTAANKACGCDEFISSLATKKYTLSRVKRHLLNSAIGSPLDDGSSVPDFTYLLAANGKGAEYLSTIRKTAGIKIITKPADAEGNTVPESMRADGLFSMCSGKDGAYIVRMKPSIIR